MTAAVALERERQAAEDVAVPADLETPRAKLVYVYLLANGCADADRIAADLSMRKLSLYAVLESLVSRGLVDTVADGYVAL